jgi:hypothetical protein
MRRSPPAPAGPVICAVSRSRLRFRSQLISGTRSFALFARSLDSPEDTARIMHVAVRNVLRHSGHVVLLSGSTLSATFLVLTAFPENFLQSIGLAAFVALCCSMLSNLLLTSVMLLTWPSFFSNFSLLPECCMRPLHDRGWCLPGKPHGSDYVSLRTGSAEAYFAAHQADMRSASASSVGGESGLVGSQSFAAGGDSSGNGAFALHRDARHSTSATGADLGHGQGQGLGGRTSSVVTDPRGDLTELALSGPLRSCWARVARFTAARRRNAFAALLLVLAVVVPVSWRVQQLVASFDEQLLFVRGSASLTALQHLKQDFSPGHIDQYFVILTSGAEGGVLTPEYYNATARLSHAVLQRGLADETLDSGSVTSLTRNGLQDVSFDAAVALLLNFSADPDHAPAEAVIYASLFGQVRAVCLHSPFCQRPLETLSLRRCSRAAMQLSQRIGEHRSDHH